MMRTAVVCVDPGIPVFGAKGASIHLQAVLSVLIDRGHDVHLVSVRPAGRRPGVTVHDLPGIAGSDPSARERDAMAADATVASVLDRLGPDLVYERYSLWGRTAMAWARSRGVPCVLEVNAPLIAEQLRYRHLHHVADAVAGTRLALGAAGTVVCVSQPVADWAVTAGARPHTVLVEPNGVDTRRIYPRRGPGRHDDVFTVGFLGTVKPWHGVDLLSEAVADLHRVDPTWRMLVVGDGPHAAAVRATAAARSLAGALEFAGTVSPDDVVTWLHRFDVATAPYPAGSANRYFSPLKVYEYLAAGLPVVASAVGQLPAALDHGRLGQLVPAGDVGALTCALRGLRADRDRRRRLAVAGRAAAVQRHTWDGVVARILRRAVGSAA